MPYQERDCLFCKIAKGEIPSKKAYEDAEIFAFYDINPQAPTHILIIPKEHICTTNDIEAKYAELMGKIVIKAADIAKEKGFDEDGYRLVFNCNKNAGQEVFHIHLHLLGGRAMKWPPG